MGAKLGSQIHDFLYTDLKYKPPFRTIIVPLRQVRAAAKALDLSILKTLRQIKKWTGANVIKFERPLGGFNGR